MAMMAPKARKHLSADALCGMLRTGFAGLADHRSGKPDISLTDALMSAFALFSLKSPSLLAFDKERTEGNLQRVYGIERKSSIPSLPSPCARCSSTSLAPFSAAKR